MRASDKMDSCDIRAALQILQTSVRAPQTTQTASEVHSLVAVDTDEHEITKIKNAMCSGQAGGFEIHAPTSEVGETNGQGVVLAAEPGPSGCRNGDTAAIGRAEGEPAVLREWIGT